MFSLLMIFPGIFSYNFSFYDFYPVDDFLFFYGTI